MRRFGMIVLGLVLMAGLALAEEVATANFTLAKDVTAAKVASATAAKLLKIGEISLPPKTEVTYGVFCSGANKTLTCEARKGDGAVVAKSAKFEVAAGNVVVFLERTNPTFMAVKTVKLVVAGTVLRFGGQDMGDF
jgi:hypothetical protein